MVANLTGLPVGRNLRAAFSETPNLGQYLRWEAALEEMRTYHAVPPAFRAMVLRRFAAAVPRILSASPWVTMFGGSVCDPDVARDENFRCRLSFPSHCGTLKDILAGPNARPCTAYSIKIFPLAWQPATTAVRDDWVLVAVILVSRSGSALQMRRCCVSVARRAW